MAETLMKKQGFAVRTQRRTKNATAEPFSRECAFSPSTHLDVNKTEWYNAAQRWADPPKMEGRMA